MRKEENNGVVLTGTTPTAIPVNFGYTTQAVYPYPNQAYAPPTTGNYVPTSTSSGICIRTQSFHRKSVLEAYILCLLLGIFGAHHFYLRRPGIGLAYLATFGLLGVGIVVDLFRIPSLVKDANKRSRDPELNRKKRLDDAYVLWLPFGLLGFHHFYLRNHALGVLYFFTFGILGIGWLLDLFLMPVHVKRSNEQQNTENKNISTAYLYGATPLGLCGAHHFYLNRPLWGIFYIHTLGVLGIGWVVDWFRMPYLVKRCNKIFHEGDDGRRHIDDAYMLWFPCGLLGFHHFYLSRPGWGFLYFFTLGLFGLGWLIDFVRLPCLVQEYNKTLSGKKVVPARQGIILSTPDGTAGYLNNTNVHYMPNTYGGTQNTYIITPNSAPQYPITNQLGYQTGVHPNRSEQFYNGGYTSQDLNPPPYSSICPNTQADPLPRKANPS